MKRTVFAMALLCMAAACNEAKKEETPKAEVSADPASVIGEARKAIDEMNLTYGDGFAKKDSSLFLSHYTSDGCIMPPNGPKLCGKEGLMGFFNAGIHQMGVGNITVKSDEVFGSEDAMVEIGQYQLFADSAKTKSVDKGKYIVVWRKEDGKWKMHRDIFNSSPAEAPPAPAK